VAVTPLVVALGACRRIGVTSKAFPAVALAAFSVGIHAAVILVVACVFATLAGLRFRV